MVIFHSYVSLPEGNPDGSQDITRSRTGHPHTSSMRHEILKCLKRWPTQLFSPCPSGLLRYGALKLPKLAILVGNDDQPMENHWMGCRLVGTLMISATGDRRWSLRTGWQRIASSAWNANPYDRPYPALKLTSPAVGKYETWMNTKWPSQVCFPTTLAQTSTASLLRLRNNPWFQFVYFF